MTPYYEQDGITIYHGDCRDVLPTLMTAGIDLIVTSPPYNKGMRIDGNWQGIPTPTSKGSRFRGGYGTHTDDMPMPEYEAWQRDCLRVMWGVLSDRGALLYNHKPRIINGQLWTPLTLNPDLPLRQIVVWHTGVGVNVMPAAFTPAHEWLMLFAKPQFRLASRKASVLSDVWSFNPAAPAEHPCPFPVELVRRAIQATDSYVVCDPFMGSGTTLRAAKDLGRNAIGIELEERYCEIAAKRLQQAVLPLEVPA